ncbi:hypothetical protein O4J55_10550 [Paracoccus sp. PXZ]
MTLVDCGVSFWLRTRPVAERIHSVVQLFVPSVSVPGAAVIVTSSRVTVPSVVTSACWARAGQASSARMPAPSAVVCRARAAKEIGGECVMASHPIRFGFRLACG